jgi:UDP-N-acetylglucosamine 2-epimerase
LDGTTVEEVEAHHAETLKLVVEKTNRLAQQIEERERSDERRAEEEAQAHRGNVAAVSKRIRF